MSEADFQAECRRRFNIAVESVSDNRAAQLDDLKFAAGSPDNGWQWPEAVRQARLNDPNGSRPVLTINKLPQHIKLVTNEQRQNRPAIKVLPVDDNGDPEVAEVLNGIIRHIEVSSNADVAYDTACENQVTIGEGYWRVLTDYCDDESFDQDLIIAPIRNSFSVYLDPNGLIQDSTGAKCKWGFITEDLSLDEFKKLYPDAKGASDWQQMGTGDDVRVWFEDDTVRIAEYFYFEEEDKALYLWPDGSISDDKSIGTPVSSRTVTHKNLKWCKTNGFEVLEKQDLPGKYLPIIRVAGNEYDVEGKIIVSGIVRNAKDPQRMVNYWTSQEAEMLALAPKAPFIGAAGQFEGYEDKWRKANTVNYAYLEYNPLDINGTSVPPPQRQAPPLPPAGIINAKLGSADDLQATVGQYNPSLGAEAKEKSGKAIQARQRQADVGTFHYIDNLSRGIRQLGTVILDLIPKYYDTARIARIIGENGEPDHARLDPKMPKAVNQVQDSTGAIQKIYNPTVGKYDVVVTVGPSYTTKRVEAAEAMGTLVSENPALWGVIGDLIVKNMDWPGADEMAKRIRKTIPPNLLEGEDEDPNSAEVREQQVQQAAHALGQKEAELNAGMQHLQEGMQQLTEQEKTSKMAEQNARDAMYKVEAKIAELNSKQEQLDSAERELDLKKQLAELVLENKSLGLQQTINPEVEIAKAHINAEAQIETAEIQAAHKSHTELYKTDRNTEIAQKQLEQGEKNASESKSDAT